MLAKFTSLSDIQSEINQHWNILESVHIKYYAPLYTDNNGHINSIPVTDSELGSDTPKVFAEFVIPAKEVHADIYSQLANFINSGKTVKGKTSYPKHKLFTKGTLMYESSDNRPSDCTLTSEGLSWFMQYYLDFAESAGVKDNALAYLSNSGEYSEATTQRVDKLVTTLFERVKLVVDKHTPQATKDIALLDFHLQICRRFSLWFEVNNRQLRKPIKVQESQLTLPFLSK